MKQAAKPTKKRIVRPLPDNPYIPTPAAFRWCREQISQALKLN